MLFINDKDKIVYFANHIEKSLIRHTKKNAQRVKRVLFGTPNGGRTRVANVRGWRPRPLDDGSICKRSSHTELPMVK